MVYYIICVGASGLLSMSAVLIGLVLVAIRRYKKSYKSEEPQHIYEQIQDSSSTMVRTEAIQTGTNICYEQPIELLHCPAYSTVKN